MIDPHSPVDPGASTKGGRVVPGAVWTVLGLAFLGTAFLVAVWARLDVSFGPSHDGYNTSVWMSGGRAIIDDGLVSSKLGAHVVGYEDYAHHPPGLYLVAAAMYSIGGTRPFFARLPAVLSVLTGIAVAWALLRSLGRSRLACFGGLAFAVGAPMLLLWGPMLNHESMAMPWALAALLITVRAHRGERVGLWLAALVGFGGAILSWQGLLLVVLLVGSMAVPVWRLRGEGRRVLLALGAGAAVALVCTVAWQLWVYGDLQNVIDAFRYRTNGATIAEFGFVSAQIHFLNRGYPVWTILLTGYGVCLLWRERVSAIVSATLIGAVVAYMLVFRNGATIHSYWNYWSVMVVMVAIAAVVDRHAPGDHRSRVAVAALIVLMATLFSTVVGIKHEDEITLGARAGDVAGGTPVPQAQANLYAFASIDVPAPWLSYAVRRPVSLLVDPVEVQRLAAQEPDAVVFVQRSTVDTAHAGVFDALAGRAIVRRDPYETVRLGDLADALR